MSAIDAVVARVANVDGVPMSALVADAGQPRAVIVALHGGGTTSAYFDCPGRPRLSLLRIGASLGFTVIALDRPGFGSSAPYDDHMADPQRRAELAYEAVDGIVGSGPGGAGLFLLAHSNGSELALRMAVHERGLQLLGLEISGTGRRHQPAARDVLKRPEIREIRRGVGELLWQASHLYPNEVIGGVGSPAGSPAYEGSIVRNWPKRDFPALAGQVRVPVRFTLADHEPFWESGPQGLADVAAMFTASPRVVVNEQRGSGHNLSLGLTATAYHLGVLSFVEECVVARQSAGEQAGIGSEAS
jgi:pimeloyl-ACP methyl ester carboxylesterase